MFRAEANDVLHGGAVVPTPFEEHDFATRRQMRDAALEAPLRWLPFRRNCQGRYPADPQV